MENAKGAETAAIPTTIITTTTTRAGNLYS